jgi:hypothetical protein
VAAASAAVLHLVFFRGFVFVFPFPPGSSGVFFDEAWRIVNGEVMYRDFFEFVGPVRAHLDALALLLGGPRITALGWSGVALGTALAVLAHALAARVAPPRWRLLAPAAMVALVYAPYTFGDHKWPALLFAAAGLLVLWRAQGGRGHATAGALLGTAVLCTQDLGAGALAGALGAVAWRRGAAAALAVLAGAAAPPLAAFAYFAARAGAAVVLYDWIVFPLTRYREINPFRLGIDLTGRNFPRELGQLVLAGTGVAGAFAELRRGRGGDHGAQVLAAAGLGALAATVHRGVYPAVVAVQAALLVPLAVGLLAARTRSVRGTPLSAAATAIVCAGILHGSAGLALWRQALQPMTLAEHRAGRVYLPRPMPELAWIEARTRPGEGVFLLPARGGNYFLTGTRDVTALPYAIEGQHTPEQARAVLARIDAARPRVGLWDQRPWPRSDPDAAGPLDELFAGLLERYRAERLPSGVFLLTRRDD